jgi:fermentation-respiration switch protein FrsA (DUF1100 family)
VAKVTVPTLVIHGDSDAIVPFEVSGKRSHELIHHSELVVIEGGPHGINASHAEQFNRALVDFLARRPRPAAPPPIRWRALRRRTPPLTSETSFGKMRA